MKCYYIIEYKPNGLIYKEYGESKREAVKNFSKRMNVEYKLVNKYSNYTHQVIEKKNAPFSPACHRARHG